MRRGMPTSAEELSYFEKKVLLALGKLKKASPEEIRAAGKFRAVVEVMNAASWLQAKGLVSMKERIVRSYRLARPGIARRSLPERRALMAAIKAGGKIPVPKLKASCKFTEGNLAVALGWLRRKGWAEVSKGPEGSVVTVTAAGKAAIEGKGAEDIINEIIKELSAGKQGEFSLGTVIPERMKNVSGGGLTPEKQGRLQELRRKQSEGTLR